MGMRTGAGSQLLHECKPVVAASQRLCWEAAVHCLQLPRASWDLPPHISRTRRGKAATSAELRFRFDRWARSPVWETTRYCWLADGCQLAASARANWVGTTYQKKFLQTLWEEQYFSQSYAIPVWKKKQKNGKQRDYIFQALFKCISFSQLESTVESYSSQ